MKKFGLLSVLILCLFLAGCRYDTDSISGATELNKQPTQNQTQEQQDDFDKKEKCAKYYDDFIKSVEEEYNIPVDGYIVDDQTFVFYSPTKNSCIGAYYVVTEHFTWYEIKDLLTNEKLYSKFSSNSTESSDKILHYYNPYKTEIYNLQGYPEGYCREIGDCYGYLLDQNT